MKKLAALLVALALMVASPTVALARGYSGGSHFSTSRSYSSHSSLPSSSSTYRSGSSSYSGSKSSSGTYHSGYTSPSSSVRGSLFGGYQRSGIGWGHFGSFAGGFFLGSMFHPFGWGYGGSWGGPGYTPGWSIVGILVDIIILIIVIRLISRIFRGRSRRTSTFASTSYGPTSGTFGARAPLFHQLDEQSVVDACCEYVASRQGCHPRDVDVDLTFDRDVKRFGAHARTADGFGRTLSQQDLVDAVAEFVGSRENVPPRDVTVDLIFDENSGVNASARVR